jgi:PKD repeat protein
MSNRHLIVKSAVLATIILSVTLFGFAANTQVNAAGIYDLSVRVLDPNNSPIANATVTIVGPTGNPAKYSVSTDNTGWAYFHGFSEGTYQISASSHAYPASTPLVIELDQNRSVGINFGYTKAFFTVSPTRPAVNATVSFDASVSGSSGVITGYMWDFGDGAATTGLHATHIYHAAGVYEVSLTVTSTIGAATYKQTVTVGSNTIDIIPELIIALILLLLLPLFIFLFLRRKPSYIVIQAVKPKCAFCNGNADCDGSECEMAPC